MKFFKYTMVAAVSAMALGFTACSDDDEYQPGLPGTGVFLPGDQKTEITLETASTGFNVTIARSGLSDAATYALVSTVSVGGAELTAEENPFHIPASVEFAADEMTVELTIAVNGADLTTGAPYKVSIALGEGTPVFNYGNSAASFTVVRAAAWGEWEEYGDGLATWNYAQGFWAPSLQGDDPDLPLSIRHNLENSNLHQFRLEHWAFDQTLIIDWDSNTNYAQIEPQPVGENLNVNGLGTVPCYIATVGALKATDANLAASTFDPETGEFDLYVYYIVPYNGSWGMFDDGGYEYLTCGEYADYSLAMKYNGYITDADGMMNANITVSVGAEATEARFAVSNTLDAQGLLAAILQGTAETVSAPAGQNQNVNIPVTAAGTFTLVGVTYKGEEPMDADYLTFEVFGGTSGAAWKNVATVDFVDGWITPLFVLTDKDGNVVPYTELGWQVQGQENTEKPGIYRLKSPWTNPNYVLQYLGANSNTTPTDLIIDATNPQCVKIVPQYSGFTEAGVDEETKEPYEDLFYVGNAAGYFSAQGIEDADIISRGLNTVMEDGYIKVDLCFIGLSPESCDSPIDSQPYAEIFFDFASAGAPAKVAAKRPHFDVARVNASIKSAFRIPAMKNTVRTLSSDGEFKATAKPLRVRK